MKTIIQRNNYQLIQYSEDFICLDYVTKSVGMTIATFDNVQDGLKAIENIDN